MVIKNVLAGPRLTLSKADDYPQDYQHYSNEKICTDTKGCKLNADNGRVLVSEAKKRQIKSIKDSTKKLIKG